MPTLVVILSLIDLSLQKNMCKAPLDRGNSDCSFPREGIRWFYDSELDECFEYFYEGCDGGSNTFKNYFSCRRRCIMTDRSSCAGNTNNTGSCSNGRTCPEGSECKRKAFFSVCCDKENEEEWRKEYNPHCELGILSMRKTSYGETTRLGRSCSHKFCPSGYECIQGNHLAYCCSEDEDEEEYELEEDDK
ncbi:Kunitz/Bovine pancreatic trypsin inhibitor domain protein [Oesophagostomum dentatum]|uniref:Kunitz/Bovine pancreatic trypsin inhibitor domain protein n=1 Tax=Oesophagostomum dentatum TaxID=61180 RepID=A0A0B1T3A2_OESDE|nr:Kunitz/Bovine pancreatic trypsin inhibitor domain protein [Oesophagostomum dentatum]